MMVARKNTNCFWLASFGKKSFRFRDHHVDGFYIAMTGWMDGKCEEMRSRSIYKTIVESRVDDKSEQVTI